MWLNRVRESGTSDLNITWKSFSLEQVNSKEGPDWKVWDHPQREQSRSLLALWAAEAARRQGTEAFERFHLALLTARHGGDGRIPLNEIAPMLDVAETSSLDVAKFQRDLNDKGLLDNVARDHTEATQDYGVFGTPTFIFESGNAVYLKSFIPPVEESIEFFHHFIGLMSERSYLGELKRPQPPWPRGAVS